VASWFCDFSQYDNLFNFWFNFWVNFFFEFILIYLNDLKLGIKKYHLFLQIIAINNDSISMTMIWHAMCQQNVIINNQPHHINFNKITFIDWSKMFIMPKHLFYDLFYAIIMSNTIKEMIKNVYIN
jgi:hypothetical protein